jgi:hypothetical protein
VQDRLNFIFGACYKHRVVCREKINVKSRKDKEKEMRGNMKLVTVLLPEAHLEGLDELVRAKMYQNRSAAIRNAVRDLLKNELYEAKKSRR